MGNEEQLGGERRSIDHPIWADHRPFETGLFLFRGMGEDERERERRETQEAKRLKKRHLCIYVYYISFVPACCDGVVMVCKENKGIL